MRALLLWIAVGSTASADVLRTERSESENIHIADQGGAINTRIEGVITVELQSKGQLAVTATGSNNVHNLYVAADGTSRNTDNTTAWTTTWKGTWTKAKGVLGLSLALVKDDCKSTSRDCIAASATATVRCVAQKISVETDPKPREVEAWSCQSREALGESAGTWVFGKKQCVKLVGGHRSPISYRGC